MPIEQAIHTSLVRGSRAGYHVVARSPGVSEADIQVLAAWSPSHGALLTDLANRTSVNFYPLPNDRFCLSRTCEGPPEYSGRGGRQVYTHALILDAAILARGYWRPLALYYDALARGHMRYCFTPATELEPIELGHCYRPRTARSAEQLAQSLPISDLFRWRDDLLGGKSLVVSFAGDRIRLFDALLGLLPETVIRTLTFTTGLRPSVVRPFRLGPEG